jgi:hypothetical protein
VTRLVAFLGAFVLLSALVAPSRAQFVPIDSVVSDPTSTLPDPEFDHTDFRFAWKDDTGRVWVGRMDPQTGAFTPRNGQGFLVDTTAWSGQVNGIGNGPEWGNSQNGPEIYYTDLITGGNPALAKAVPDGNDWLHTQLPNANSRALPIASADPSYPNACITYMKMDGPGTGIPQWRVENNPPTEHQLPSDGSGGGGRWIPGQRAFTIALVDSSTGIRQAAKYLIDSNAVEFLTTDLGDKVEVWMWPAPEFGNQYVFMCVNESTGHLNVYKETSPGNADWQMYYTIAPPARYPYVLSPEFFTFDGRSYVFLQMSSTPTQGSAPADIWISTIDPALPFYRQVSDTSVLSRRDPEYYILQTGPVIYYTEIRGSTRVIHRVSTGLSAFPPYVGVNESRPPVRVAFAPPSPNPVRERALVSYAIEENAHVRIDVHDVQGRHVARLVDAVHDAGRYSATWHARDAPHGVYLATLTAGSTRRSHRLVVIGSAAR